MNSLETFYNAVRSGSISLEEFTTLIEKSEEESYNELIYAHGSYDIGNIMLRMSQTNLPLKVFGVYYRATGMIVSKCSDTEDVLSVNLIKSREHL